MITPEWRPEAKQLRQFALICPFGFAAVGLVVWRSTGAVWPAALLGALGVLACVVGLVQPERIRAVYIGLLAISVPIGWVVSGFLLRLVFFGVITPVGLLFRIVGRDALRLRRPATDSYWLEHEPRDDAAGYFRQA